MARNETAQPTPDRFAYPLANGGANLPAGLDAIADALTARMTRDGLIGTRVHVSLSPIQAGHGRTAWFVLDVPLDAALKIERKALQLLMSSEDKAEGIASFLEKRPPVFRGR